MHPDFHNIKLRGEINFKANIEELKSGVSYGDLTKAYVPKTPEEQAKVEARQQMTKEQLFTKLDHDVKEALIEFPNDEFITILSTKIEISCLSFLFNSGTLSISYNWSSTLIFLNPLFLYPNISFLYSN